MTLLDINTRVLNLLLWRITISIFQLTGNYHIDFNSPRKQPEKCCSSMQCFSLQHLEQRHKHSFMTLGF